MSFRKDVLKTEHGGPKRGLGAYGIKKDAKNNSNVVRRRNAKIEISQQLKDLKISGLPRSVNINTGEWMDDK